MQPPKPQNGLEAFMIFTFSSPNGTAASLGGPFLQSWTSLVSQNLGVDSSLIQCQFQAIAEANQAAADRTMDCKLSIRNDLEARAVLSAQIDAIKSTLGSSPASLVVLGSDIYYAAFQPGVGQALFSLDTSNDSISVAADVISGSQWSDGSIRMVQTVGGKVYFDADSGTDTDRRLHEYDPATGQAASLCPTTSVGGYSWFTSDSLLYFLRETSSGFSSTLELWTLDPTTGTCAATASTTHSLMQQGFGVIDGVVYYSGRTNLYKYDLVAYTEATDSAVTVTGQTFDTMSSVTAHAGAVYFSGAPSSSERELWKYDPVAQTTSQMFDLRGTSSSSPSHLFGVGSKLLMAVSMDDGDHLACFDIHSQQVTTHTFDNPDDFVTSHGAVGGDYFTFDDNVVYFSADDNRHGDELWSYNIATDKVSIVEDLWPGPGASSPSSPAVVGSTAYFAAYSPAAYQELMRFDQGAASISLVRDLNESPAGFSPYRIEQCAGKVFAGGHTLLNGTTLVELNTTEESITPVDIGPYQPDADAITVANDEVILLVASRSGGSYFAGPVVVECATGAVKEQSQRLSQMSSSQQGFAYINGTAIYPCSRSGQPSTGTELCLWQVAEDVETIVDTRAGYTGGLTMTMWFASIGTTAYFRCQDDNSWYQLCSYELTNGTLSRPVVEINPSSSPNAGYALALPRPSGSDLVLFSANHPTAGVELMYFDPSTGHADLVFDAKPGSQGSNPTRPTLSSPTVDKIAFSTSGTPYVCDMSGFPSTAASCSEVPTTGEVSAYSFAWAGAKLFFKGSDNVVYEYDTTGGAPAQQVHELSTAYWIFPLDDEHIWATADVTANSVGIEPTIVRA